MIERIVVGTDGSGEAERAVIWAGELAANLDAELLVVHVFETDPARLPGGYAVLSEDELRRLREQAQRCLDGDWTACLKDASARFRTIRIEGNAAGALIDLAEREEADLLVAGSRGRGGFAELLLGSVGHQLVLHAKVPVTIVPSR
ncbi:Nucleotide-binding universal stress protein, UspA family [Tistlia consotensis]|uniref:Nucleotide-binding universal stress protein, UspA family n=1 Tax=Tistlia consotensis USBA 355 TaxID=560819 RepID=A0A1Y6BYD9_9PROT|nr:universal stress protein [Tistlia consotensis]SMF27352.1 Nucleotide-binding universal stress protein, UspA family [Tistlia consotensis USBA 355]SNR66170.1 Nucleotide-binding universal stress protein, UspA family [Tistlia consotensis]